MIPITKQSFPSARYVAAARSPLFDILGVSNSVDELPNNVEFAMGERQFLGKLSLLGSGTSFMKSVSKTFGCPLPTTPNTASHIDKCTALWLSPEEWLLVVPAMKEEVMAASLSKSLSKIHSLIMNVSDRWTAITVVGSKTVNVLSKGTSMNLDPAVFGAGQCCQTKIGAAQIIIHRPSELDLSSVQTFDIFVDSTFAEYLWRWLENAAEEFGSVVFSPCE